ncbi:MAG TPA: tripartite tricarboxylate transporter TctB family protein [Casimicrobiaceae bacterium]|nr:tripartite tricarboxylate transporter TctB family protein [Casimicrobiaceae bacterium]
MKINDAIFGALFILLGVVVLVHVQSFPRIPGQQYGPGLFPGSIAAGFVICGVLLVVNGIRHRHERWFSLGKWARVPSRVLALLAVFGGVVLYIVAAERVGFLIIAPLVLLLWLRAFGVRWGTAIVTSIVTTLIIWYAFYKLLRVPLPWGVLTRWAF